MSAEQAAAAESSIDGLVDEVLPEELHWKRLVVRYPKTALLVALCGGFYLGRQRGVEIVDSLSRYAADTVVEGVNQALGGDVL